MAKLFFSVADSNGETGYVHYKQFTQIYFISVLLMVGLIPLLIILGTGSSVEISMSVIGTIIVTGYYIYLWRGGNREKIIYKTDGNVTIIDHDLYGGQISFHIREIAKMEVNTKAQRHATGIGSSQMMSGTAQLVISFVNGSRIYLGSATYGGQLRMMKNFLWAKYDTLDAKNSKL